MATTLAERAPASIRTSHVAGLLAAIVVLTWLPYAVAGVGFLADDWTFLRNAHVDGILGTAGAPQAGRPGAAAAYVVLFGVVGAHPLAAYALLGLLRFAVAWALFRLLDDHVDRRAAALAVVLWLVVPTHVALEQWASTIQAGLALWLLLAGARRILRGDDGLVPAALLGASVLCYELVLPLAAVLALVPIRRSPRAALAVGAAALWVVSHPVYGLSTGRLDLTSVLPAHLGGAWPIVLLAAIWAWWRSPDDDVRRLLTWGGLTFVLGVGVLATHGTSFVGLEDRLTAVSGIGVALVLAGVLLALPRPAALAGLAVVVLVAVPIRLDLAQRYHDAARHAIVERDALVAEHGCDVPDDVTVAVDRGIGGLLVAVHAEAAVEVAPRCS